ncbi:MAG: menaquinone biosynthesis protein [Planctomycetes bacterium]|nr:menaquinone biosynthesis protein [Planctomycetota bacterium]
MQPARSTRQTQTRRTLRRVGCVSYLNAKPLIDGLEPTGDPRVRFDVPSRLLEDLESGDVDIALCPVIDFFRSRVPLEIVPVGGIGCNGPTLTVRLYSRTPIEQITAVHADTDSHTSVALLKVILDQQHNIRPTFIDYNARENVAGNRIVHQPSAMMLIGDKVVTDSPPAVTYPHQIDLGEAWHRLTGMPFVFAVWMCRRGADLGDLPALLDRRRIDNARRIAEIVDRYAPSHRWPRDLALEYLGRLLRYEVGRPELAAVERFASLAGRLGIIDSSQPLHIRV